jgi:hypothetical protein
MIMQPAPSKPSLPALRTIAVFVLVMSFLALTLLGGGFFFFTHLGIQSDVAWLFATIIFCLVTGSIIWFGGLGLKTRAQRAMSVLWICAWVLVDPLVVVGLQMLGTSHETASSIGTGAWFVAAVAVILLEPKISKAMDHNE